jgi:hypothetical protein
MMLRFSLVIGWIIGVQKGKKYGVLTKSGAL